MGAFFIIFVQTYLFMEDSRIKAGYAAPSVETVPLRAEGLVAASENFLEPPFIGKEDW